MKIIQEWLRDFNTNDNDNILAFAADTEGNVYVTGYSQVAMIGAAQLENLTETVTTLIRKGVPTLRPKKESLELPSADGKLGETQVWLMKFTSSGAMAWKKELELGTKTLTLSLAVDADGDVLLASRSDDHPAMLIKYGSRGNKRWSVELDPQPLALLDMTTDSEKNIYLAASRGTDDAIINYILRFDSSSNPLGVIDNAGAVDVVGVDTDDKLVVAGRAPWGVFVGKLDIHNPEAKEVWRRQLEAGETEVVTAIATDASSNIYVVGVIDDEISSPEVESGTDAWLAKYSRDGQRQWFKRLTQSVGNDHASGLVIDDGGYIYVAGHTNAEIVAGQRGGEQDVWIGKYMPDGSNLWIQQHAVTDDDTCHGVALDQAGNLYLAGTTEPQGAFPNDGWISRLREEPETPMELWALMRAYTVGK